jgi:hypothetical protein
VKTQSNFADILQGEKVVSHEAGNTVISVLAKILHQATEVTSIALQKKSFQT